MSPELMTQIGETLCQILAFVIFFWILKRFAWGPVTKLLDERQRRIEEGFEDIKRKQADAERLHEEYAARLRDIETEARTKIQAAIAEGRRVAGEITENAREESVKITDRAQRNIQLEIEKARLELRGEIVALTMATTERLLREKLDETAHQRMVATFIEDVERQMFTS